MAKKYKKPKNKLPKQVLVVIDLAYFEYVTANDYVKTSEILNKFNDDDFNNLTRDEMIKGMNNDSKSFPI